ncbi:MAG: hypothetical protein FWC91_08165 [Defluviitaleaceae bacterium]|nr:hypothetical protein [Defluviitaleaceae bacterium]
MDYIYDSQRKTSWSNAEERTPVQEFIHRHYQETGESEFINSYVPNTCQSS